LFKNSDSTLSRFFRNIQKIRVCYRFGEKMVIKKLVGTFFRSHLKKGDFKFITVVGSVVDSRSPLKNEKKQK
jgi:hypothetical protein